MTLMAEHATGGRGRRRRRRPSVEKVDEEGEEVGIEEGQMPPAISQVAPGALPGGFDTKALHELLVNQSAEKGALQIPASPPSTDSKDSSSTDIDAKGRIFVAKIPRTVTEDEFKEYFSEYGVVSDAYMPRDRTQRYYRGIGFITFESEESANKVMAIKHRFHEQDVVVDYALPPKKQRTDQESGEESDSKSTSKSTSKSSTPESTPKPSANAKALPTQTSLLSQHVLQSHVKNTNSHETSGSILSGARLPTSFADGNKKASVGLSPASARWPQSQGLMDSITWGLPAQDSMTLPAHYGTRYNDTGTGMRNSASRDFSLDGSLQHSHSFASTTDLSCLMHDSSADFSSTRSFSQDSELQHLGHNNLRSMELSPMSSLSHDDLFQAFRDLPQFAPNTQTLQDYAAMRSVARRMTSINLQSLNDQGVYSPSERCSSQQSLLSASYDHFGQHTDTLTEKLLSHSFSSNAFGSQSSIAQLSFRNWQKGLPKVFVAGLPRGMTRRDLSDYFNQFGSVFDIYMPQPWDIPSDQGGFAFVSFQSSAAAQGVATHGTHWIRNCPVTINMIIA